MTTATARIQNQLLNNRADFHSSQGNNLLAFWMRASANHFGDVYNNLVEVERFLDTRDEELLIAHSREDESREFDHNRYSYDRLDDFHCFQEQWYTVLDENEDNLEW